MTSKPVVPRARALADIDEAVDHYAQEAGGDVALRFVDALQDAFERTGQNPATGSSSWSHDLGLPGLRTRRIRGFPWLIFYIELDAHVDVWRILHTKRDIPISMTKLNIE
ncbi:type II toxin-antitoxin system RelE/ParE family toxin [Novosphingobium sp. MBES04]|uniref:type II toxin-antitoxin system RelE/ParE family toxin n=1 Tax=Novosphingobium sp. MBES04 TaxID=1206458 RepID=UPI00057C74F1|nr:type II toxin-antitoxin system RelE/ParE family toxin [Novosphingobium sp. MBES04]